MPPKPVPAIIRRLATPYLDQLCPAPKPCPVPEPCPIPPPPEPVKKPLMQIDSLFCQLSIIDLGCWRAIGVKSLAPAIITDSPALSNFIGAAREFDFKIILPTPIVNWPSYNEDRWIGEVQSLAQSLAKYEPDGWYVAMEINIGWGGGESAYKRAITTLRQVRDVTIYTSPYYWAGPPIPSDDVVRANMESFCSQVSQAGGNIVSVIQCGGGCDYNVPRRIIGSPSHQDFLNKGRIHREICEKYGWKATVNVELFDTWPDSGMDKVAYPATADRIRSQIEQEGLPALVSDGLGLGPCCDGTGISLRRFDSAWYPYHKEVCQMLLKGDL